jgi:hypothetical protein
VSDNDIPGTGTPIAGLLGYLGPQVQERLLEIAEAPPQEAMIVGLLLIAARATPSPGPR